MDDLLSDSNSDATLVLVSPADQALEHAEDAEEKRVERAIEAGDDVANNPWATESWEEKRQRKLANLRGRSLFLFGPKNPVRLFLARVVTSYVFEVLIMIIIVFSSILLALDSPSLAPDSRLARFLVDTDKFFTPVFVLEAVMKIIAHGLLFHKGAYLRSGWNIIDALVVLVSIATYIFTVRLKWLRALRAIRPLRVISRFSGMKIVVSSLVKSLPSILNVLLVCSLFWVIFGILGVQFFGGKFSVCIGDETVLTRENCVGTFYNPDSLQVESVRWEPVSRSFDNILHAILLLFELATLENWPDIMCLGVDAVSDTHVPVRDNNQWAALFFIGFIIVGAFFAVNLFVGVVIDHFSAMKDRHTGSALLTRAQRDWVDLQKMMVRFKPIRLPTPPKNAFRRALFSIGTSRPFEFFVLGCIILNIVALMVTHYNQGPEWNRVLDKVNIIFVLVFSIEALFKILGMGRDYFTDSWNIFDFAIVILSIVGLVVNIGFGGTVFRGLRVFRIFKLIKWARGINELLMTLFYSLPTLSNVGSLLLLVFYVYAIAGVRIFGKVVRHDQIDRFANFETFPRAMLLLFRAVTGENWNSIMYDCAVQEPFCSNDLAIDNCGSRLAYPFWVTFQIIVFFVLVNLFVAIILESFAEITGSNNEASGTIINSDNFSEFSRKWALFDPKSTHYMDSSNIIPLIRRLSPPLGVGASATNSQIVLTVLSLNVPVYNGRVFYKDLLFALAKRHRGVPVPPVQALKDIERMWPKHSKEVRNLSPQFSVNEAQAATRIQQVWRDFVRRKREQKTLHAVEREKRRLAAEDIKREEKAMERIQFRRQSVARAEMLANSRGGIFGGLLGDDLSTDLDDPEILFANDSKKKRNFSSSAALSSKNKNSNDKKKNSDDDDDLSDDGVDIDELFQSKGRKREKGWTDSDSESRNEAVSINGSESESHSQGVWGWFFGAENNNNNNNNKRNSDNDDD